MEKKKVAIIKELGNNAMSREMIKDMEQQLEVNGLLFIESKINTNNLMEIGDAIGCLQRNYGRINESSNILDELSKASDDFNEDKTRTQLELIPWDFYSFKNKAQLLNIFSIGVNTEDGLRAIYLIHPDLFEEKTDDNGNTFIRCYFIQYYVPYLEAAIKNIENPEMLLENILK